MTKLYNLLSFIKTRKKPNPLSSHPISEHKAVNPCSNGNQLIIPDLVDLPKVKNNMMKICVPHPSIIESSMPFFGGRNTSP